MSKNYIGFINNNQTFTNDGIRLNEQNYVKDDIKDDQLGKINNNFTYLQELLNKQKREINYLDIYKVDASVGETDEQKVGQFFARLPAGHALNIAVPFIEFQGVIYKKGDLLLKKENGEAEKINAPTGGRFFPQINKNGHLIKWRYTSSEETSQLDGRTVYNYLGETSANIVSDLPSATLNDYIYLATNVYSGEDIIYPADHYYVYTNASTWETFLEGETFDPVEYTVDIPTFAIYESGETVPTIELSRYNRQFSNTGTAVWNIQQQWITVIDIIISENISEDLLPIVKYYNLNKEEVYCDAILTTQNETREGTTVKCWQITNIPGYVKLVKIY